MKEKAVLSAKKTLIGTNKYYIKQKPFNSLFKRSIDWNRPFGK